MYLNPPSSSYQQTSLSYVFTSYLNPAISSKLHPPINGFFQCFPHAPKLLSTLRLGEVSAWAKNLSRICNWRGRSRGKLIEIVQMIMGLQSLTLKCIAEKSPYTFMSNVGLCSVCKNQPLFLLRTNHIRTKYIRQNYNVSLLLQQKSC